MFVIEGCALHKQWGGYWRRIRQSLDTQCMWSTFIVKTNIPHMGRGASVRKESCQFDRKEMFEGFTQNLQYLLIYQSTGIFAPYHPHTWHISFFDCYSYNVFCILFATQFPEKPICHQEKPLAKHQSCLVWDCWFQKIPKTFQPQKYPFCWWWNFTVPLLDQSSDRHIQHHPWDAMH